VNLTPEQRDQAVDYFDGHALLREAADMLQVPWSSFVDDWREGKRDAEAGQGTEAAAWYLSCRAARSRARAKLRTEAHATAGSRESADLLSLLRALEAEAEPVAADDENPRASGSLALVDILNDPALSDEERAEAKAAHERYVRAGLDVFRFVLRRDERRREQRSATRAAQG
jgi:hypothetical protein